MIRSVEDSPEIWEEEFALQHRELIIDEKIFKNGIKYTCEKLKQYCDKYDTGLNISLNMEDDFSVKITESSGRVLYQLNFDYTEAMSIIKLVGTEYFITISIVKSQYVIKYFNMNKKPRTMYFFNENIMEGLIKELLLK